MICKNKENVSRKESPSDGGTEKTREQEPAFSHVSLNGSYINMVINNDLGFLVWSVKNFVDRF